MKRQIYRNPTARAWRTTHSPSTSAFHRSLPGYAPTRLVEVPELAAELGVARVFVKEEASRLGLPAFKILGASYAIARALSVRLGETSVLSLERLRERVNELGELRLIAATDGNHGRAVARTARMIGIPASIFVPASITGEAKDGITSEGADRIDLEVAYDDVVEVARAAAADDQQSLLIQDTSWPGYEDIPAWIVDGYETLVEEADAQLIDAGITTGVDVVFMPVGVGSLAQAVVRHYRSGEYAPSIVSVEPDAAPALFTSLEASEPMTVDTSVTIMAGLNCGTPTNIGWPTLRDGTDVAVTVADDEAAQAVHDLESLQVDAGPCGAATLAGARQLAEAGVLSQDAVVLLLSTEGREANPLPGNFSSADV